MSFFLLLDCTWRLKISNYSPLSLYYLWVPKDKSFYSLPKQGGFQWLSSNLKLFDNTQGFQFNFSCWFFSKLSILWLNTRCLMTLFYFYTLWLHPTQDFTMNLLYLYSLTSKKIILVKIYSINKCTQKKGQAKLVLSLVFMILSIFNTISAVDYPLFLYSLTPHEVFQLERSILHSVFQLCFVSWQLLFHNVFQT